MILRKVKVVKSSNAIKVYFLCVSFIDTFTHYKFQPSHQQETSNESSLSSSRKKKEKQNVH